LKVAFAGTPEFAATVLRGLADSIHDVGLVVSQPDARRGRGRKQKPTPVAELARTLELPLRQPARISEVSDEISACDALGVAAYGQILRPDTLYAASEGAWNVHASLLPKYRGAAPVERAIMDGERETGVTIIRMDEGLDAGPMALQRPTEIPPDMTGGELTDLLAHMGAEAIVEVLSQIQTGEVNLTEQDSLNATYASKLSDEDLVIRWDAEAREAKDLVRALSPHIGARTFHPEVEGPIKIWFSRVPEGVEDSLDPGFIRAKNGRLLVGCGVGVLEVLELQMPGAKRLAARDYLRGNVLEGAFDW
jgi:methionyl-tRNA formyltransferase